MIFSSLLLIACASLTFGIKISRSGDENESETSATTSSNKLSKVNGANVLPHAPITALQPHADVPYSVPPQINCTIGM